MRQWFSGDRKIVIWEEDPEKLQKCIEREDLVDEHIFFHFVCDRCSLRRQEDNHLVEHKCFPKFHQIAAERQSPKG